MIEAKALISDLIAYCSTQNILGITYAEALDDETVAHLNISVTTDYGSVDGKLPAKRISLISCTEEDKKILLSTLQFLSQENSTGFTYNLPMPDGDIDTGISTLKIEVDLKQISTAK